MSDHEGKMYCEPGIDEPADFYARLIAVHADLDPKQSQILNSKLVLLIVDQILNAVCANEPTGQCV